MGESRNAEQDRDEPEAYVTAYLGLGANLGDRLQALRTAVARLDAHAQIQVRRVSPVYASEAHTLMPDERQPSFLNAVVEIGTTLPAEVLLAYAHSLEEEAGRTRRQRWAARPLDIDVLLYDAVQIDREGLHVPHPRLAERRFVLQPLADLAPNLHVPEPFDASVTTLLERCPDEGQVEQVATSLS